LVVAPHRGALRDRFLAKKESAMANEFEEYDDLSMSEQDAFGLSRAAVMLDQARAQRETHPAQLVEALNHNLEVWVAIRTFAMREDSPLPDETKTNLVNLSQYVAQRTFAGHEEMSEETLDTLVNIDLQISECLLEGSERAG
jgi:flagellar biosynthesis activator protein FlaF